MIELVPLGTLTMDMENLILRGTPLGTRVVVEFRGARWKGERLDATQRGATSGDWLVVGAEGTATLDIRIVLETSDGAIIYLHGAGRTDANEVAKGGAMFFTPLFETGDERYAWLHKVQAIGKGHLDGTRATFEMFEAR